MLVCSIPHYGFLVRVYPSTRWHVNARAHEVESKERCWVLIEDLTQLPQSPFYLSLASSHTLTLFRKRWLWTSMRVLFSLMKSQSSAFESLKRRGTVHNARHTHTHTHTICMHIDMCTHNASVSFLLFHALTLLCSSFMAQELPFTEYRRIA